MCRGLVLEWLKCVRGYFTSHFMHFVGVSSGFWVLRGLRCYPSPLRRTVCRHIWANTVLVLCWKPSLIPHMTNATITNYIYTLLWKLSWDQIMCVKENMSMRTTDCKSRTFYVTQFMAVPSRSRSSLFSRYFTSFLKVIFSKEILQTRGEKSSRAHKLSLERLLGKRIN